MKYIFTLLVIISVTTKSFSQQDTSMQLLHVYPVSGIDFSVDGFGYIYLLNEDGNFIKVNDKLDTVAIFSINKKYGKLTNIDVTNPLKIILYFGTYTTALIVDRQLTISQIIDLRKLNIFQANTLATSYDNQFWLYDEQEAKLKKINNNLRITVETADMRQSNELEISPQKIIDNDQLVYVYDSAKGVAVFDYYGAFKTFVPFKNMEYFYANNNHIYGFAKNILYSYTLGMPLISEKKLGLIEQPKKITFANNKIYFLFKNEIRVYRN